LPWLKWLGPKTMETGAVGVSAQLSQQNDSTAVLDGKERRANDFLKGYAYAMTTAHQQALAQVSAALRKLRVDCCEVMRNAETQALAAPQSRPCNL